MENIYDYMFCDKNKNKFERQTSKQMNTSQLIDR